MTKRALGIVLLVAIVVTIVGVVLVALPASAEEARVVRVVDGDTVDVRIDGGSVKRVRVLNIDTPETVDPHERVQCLGPEATAFTKSKLRPGSTVTLKYDEDRKDRYGRVLAHVQLADGSQLADEIAEAGLGVPISIGANSERYGTVAAAANRAAKQKKGFFDPSIECTFPARASGYTEATKQQSAQSVGTTAAEALAASVALNALSKPYAKLLAEVESGDSYAVRAYTFAGSKSRSVVTRFAQAVKSIQEDSDAAKSAASLWKEQERKAAEEAAKKAAEEQARQAAAAQAAAEQRARQAAAARAAEAERDQSNDDDDDGGGSSGGGFSGNNGYTGPRCYAPGGKTWRPC